MEDQCSNRTRAVARLNEMKLFESKVGEVRAVEVS